MAAYPFERFTERAKKVLTLAQDEAERSRQSYIGTEHLLLGLLRESEGLAGKVLRNLGVEIGGGPRDHRTRPRPQRDDHRQADHPDLTREESHRALFRRGDAARPQLRRNRTPSARVVD